MFAEVIPQMRYDGSGIDNSGTPGLPGKPGKNMKLFRGKRKSRLVLTARRDISIFAEIYTVAGYFVGGSNLSVLPMGSHFLGS